MPAFPPYAEESLQYYLYGLRKGFLTPETYVADIEVPDEFGDPYYAGISEGEQYGLNGFPLDTVCINLAEEHHWPTIVADATDQALEWYGVAHALHAGKLLAAGFEAGIALLMLSIALETFYDYPVDAIDLSQPLDILNFIRQYPQPLSVGLYFGGGVDYNDAGGCHLKMTNVHKSVDAARAEMQEMGRPAGLLLCLRTDMSGGPLEVERYGDIL